MHVAGDAKATILPSPSLTFTDVEVDDEHGARIMDVARFEVVIELMPLLQGEFRVVTMRLEKPVVHVAVDATGNIPWMERAKAHEPFDPEKVVLDNVSIHNGSLLYDDARAGIALQFDGISADVNARALSGPWHIDGFYLDDGNQVEFRASTGRVLDDGTIRTKIDFSPARWPVTVGVDGVLGVDPAKGATYNGTYVLNEIAGADGPPASAWRSEGAFELDGSRLAITKAVLSNGPVERAFSVAGGFTLNFGQTPSFSAQAEARQIDLDRTLGNGPTEPVNISVATDSFVATLSRLPVPDIPGTIALNVPAIVVGGRVIENVVLAAEPAQNGWHISSLAARLPGQARLEASGLLSTADKFGFVGDAHLAVDQPATFATWWRGREQEGSGRLLAPFDLAGHADIAPGRIAVDKVNARIGDATITGRFWWGDVQRNRARELGTDLNASRIDFVQLKALAELLAGRNLSGTTALADKYTIRLSAGAFAFEDFQVRDLEVDAAYSDDELRVVKLAIGDIGGASFKVNSGRIESVSNNPRGHLDATLDAPTVTGLARIADQFWPDSGVARWLRIASPALAEAVVTAKITAPPPDGGTGFAFTVDNGVAGSTAFSLALRSAGGFSDWRSKPANIAVRLDSPDSAALARQFGMPATPPADDSGTHLEVQGSGVPADGLDTVVVADVAGLVANLSGKLAIGANMAPSFAGKAGLSSDNIDPLIAMAGLGIPGAAVGTAVSIDGTLSASPEGLGLEWPSGTVGTAIAGGKLTLAPDGSRGWRIGGDLAIDDVDLGWLASLGLGFAPMPTGDAAAPWSKTAFVAPTYGAVSGKIAVTADRLDVGDLGLTVTKFDLALQPQRIDLDLTAGQIAGGAVTGGLSIHNVGGNANLSARFDLKGAALESFVWKRDGRSVATGVLDLSANFEATGRSPTGLVSTMTGGGVIGIHDGEARYVNPNAVRQLVRASDLGQQYTEDALKISFGERIDADDLTFDETNGAFAIVAGAVRLKNLGVKAEGLSASGNAVIDLNAMTLDSDWTLTFDPVDNKVQGVAPKAGIVFRGPIVSPARSVDVLPFAAYLNEREAARMNEIIALDQATRAEKERLSRLSRRLSEDAVWRAEQARIAAEREAARRAASVARAVALEAFHANREILLRQRMVASLVAFADRMAAAQAAADADAAEAARIAKAERSKADVADKNLSDAMAAEKAALATLNEATAALTAAKDTDASAVAEEATLANASEDARKAVVLAVASEADARAAVEKAVSDKDNGEAALRAAAARAATASAAATKAEAAAAAATDRKDRADKVAAAAAAARDGAVTALAQAENALAAARDESKDAATSDTTLGDKVNAAREAKQRADEAAQAAADVAAGAVVRRDAAQTVFADAKAAAKDAKAAADAARRNAELAATFAEQIAVPEGDRCRRRGASEDRQGPCRSTRRPGHGKGGVGGICQRTCFRSGSCAGNGRKGCGRRDGSCREDRERRRLRRSGYSKGARRCGAFEFEQECRPGRPG